MAREPDINRLVWPKDGNKFQWMDRLETMLSVATKAGTAYLGYQAFEKASPGSGLAGAIVSQIAMKLATSSNIPAGAAGVSTLAGIGIINVYDPTVDYVEAGQTWMDNLGSYFRGIGILPPLKEEP